MPAVLVDTNVLYRWQVEPGKLTRQQQRALRIAEQSGTAISISAISVWELALLGARGRIKVHGPLGAWLDRMVVQPLISILPITPEIAAEGAQLGSGFHNDPADRIIVATARCHGLTLLTADERIKDCGLVGVI